MSVPIGACPLGLRGYQITETGTEVGGCVARECRLPSLSAWGRVGDYRQYQLSQMPNVDVYFESRLSAQDLLALGFQNIAIATGSTWLRDGVARAHVVPMPVGPAVAAYTPPCSAACRLSPNRRLSICLSPTPRNFGPCTVPIQCMCSPRLARLPRCGRLFPLRCNQWFGATLLPWASIVLRWPAPRSPPLLLSGELFLFRETKGQLASLVAKEDRSDAKG
ncbi:hypothetical protein [Mesorhizobium sp. ORM16]|uniref:hypothetical protein n=1 Tax=Mesorhizobium sp. ORM16 TaxID=3376989 RepID=UPI003857E4AE